MNRNIGAVAIVVALSVAGITTAAVQTAEAKRDKGCVCLTQGPRPRPNPAKKVRDFGGSLALAAIDTAMAKDMDSEAFAEYVIDVAKRVAYADYQSDDPVDPVDR